MGTGNPLLQPPPDDPDVEFAPAWVSGDDTRSTYDILQSCIVTFILAAVTMYHPPIPDYYQRIKWGWWRFLMLQGGLPILVLLLPEFIVFMALLEYIRARRICSKFEEIEKLQQSTGSLGVGENSSKTTHEHAQGVSTDMVLEARPRTIWGRMHDFIHPPNLEYGFYVVMGGYELLPSPDGHMDALPSTLETNQVLLCKRFGILPNVSVEVIMDQSKATVFTKVLACIQALWMVAQVIARRRAGLHVTLLEFNAVMHIVCALIASLAWLKKPHDVGVPTTVYLKTDGSGKNMEALLSVTDFMEKDKVRELDTGKTSKLKVLRCIMATGVNEQASRTWMLKEKGGEQEIWAGEENGWLSWSSGQDIWLMADTDNTSAAHTNQDLGAMKLRIRRGQVLSKTGLEFLLNFQAGYIDQLDFGATKIGFLEYTNLVKQGRSLYTNFSDWAWIADPKANPRTAFKDHPMTFYSSLAYMAFSTVYGGLHLSPWNGYFPSLLERYMWRTAACIVFTFMPLLWVIPRVAHYLIAVGKVFGDKSQLQGSQLWVKALACIPMFFVQIVFAILFFGILIAITGVYMGLIVTVLPARLYMLAEGFVSMRRLPLSAYDVASWADFWPHW